MQPRAECRRKCSEFHAPVAQLDRVLPSEGRGQRFESSRARHLIKGPRGPETRAELYVRSPGQAHALVLAALAERDHHLPGDVQDEFDA